MGKRFAFMLVVATLFAVGVHLRKAPLWLVIPLGALVGLNCDSLYYAIFGKSND